MLSICVIVHICFLIIVLLSSFGSCLQCYHCTREDTNEYCVGSDYIQSCTQSQDRCLTQTTYSDERGKLRIDKSCASEAGCEAAVAQLSKLYFCDRSRNGWGCVECCEGSLCNLNSVSALRPNAMTWFVLVCVSLLWITAFRGGLL